MVTNITLLWAGGGREEEEGDDPQVAEEPAAGQHEGGAGEEGHWPGQSDRAHADQAAWKEKEKPGMETTAIPNHTLDLGVSILNTQSIIYILINTLPTLFWKTSMIILTLQANVDHFEFWIWGQNSKFMTPLDQNWGKFEIE